MIGKYTYSDLEKISNQLKECINTLNQLIEGKENNDIENFVSIVERYEKFIVSTIELNKAADDALQDLKKQK